MAVMCLTVPLQNVTRGISGFSLSYTQVWYFRTFTVLQSHTFPDVLRNQKIPFQMLFWLYCRKTECIYSAWQIHFNMQPEVSQDFHCPLHKFWATGV